MEKPAVRACTVQHGHILGGTVETRMKTRWITGAIVGVAAAIGAGALVKGFTNIPNANGTISACAALTAHTSGNGNGNNIVDRKGTLRAIDVAAGETCQADEQPVQFNATYWATVNADGSIFASNTPIEPLGTEHNFTGLYQINFGMNLSNCVATAQTSTFNVPPGGIPIIPHTTSVGRASASQFGVAMYNVQTNAFADKEFTIVVHC